MSAPTPTATVNPTTSSQIIPGGYDAATIAEWAENEPQYEWLLEDAFDKSGAIVLASPERDLSTKIAVDAALAMATAERWLSKYKAPVIRGVGYVSTWDRVPAIAEAINRRREARELDLPDLNGLFRWVHEPPDFGDPRSMDWFVSQLAAWTTDVVFFDSLDWCVGLYPHDPQFEATIAEAGNKLLEAGVVPVFVIEHKPRLKAGVMLDVDDLTGCGAENHMRQWGTFRRRKRSAGDGVCDLWAMIGASVADSEVFELRIRKKSATWTPTTWEKARAGK